MNKSELKRHMRVEVTPQLDGEIWRPVDGFPGYEVSSLGRVRSVRVLAVNILRDRYEKIGLFSRDGRQMQQSVHRLVCRAFNGPPPEGTEVAHLDGNSRNNRSDNLAWVTHAENVSHRYLHGTAKRKRVGEPA